MAEKNQQRTCNGLREKINAIIRRTMGHKFSPQGARPIFPPPGFHPVIRDSYRPVPEHPANPKPSATITEPLDTASSAIFTAKTISKVNAEATAATTEPTSLPSEPLELVKSFKTTRNPPPSPKSLLQQQTREFVETIRQHKINGNPLPSPESSPPMKPRRLQRPHCTDIPSPSSKSPSSMNPRRYQKSLCIDIPPPSSKSPSSMNPQRLHRSHRLVAPPPSPRKITDLENRPTSGCREDELYVFVDMEMLSENAEAQNQLNETFNELQGVKFPEKLPDSPPPPYFSNTENTESSESERVPKPEKEKECIVCQRFDRLSLQKDEVHLSWLLSRLHLISHMHNICTWEVAPDKPKPKFWLSLEYQHSRQNFDEEVTQYLEILDLNSLSRAVTLYLEQFMQVLYHHTPLEQMDSGEKCEKQLKELQTEFVKLMTVREDVLKYLLYEKEGFRHNQCSSYKTAIEWIKECTLEISDGLREFEINLENLHLGRLIWSNDEL